MPPLNERNLPPLSESHGRFRRAWKESHGNLLLGVAALIFVTGIIMIWAAPEESEPTLVEISSVGEDSGFPDDEVLIRVTTDKADGVGPLRLAVYDSETAFRVDDQAIMKDSFPPVEGAVVWGIKAEMLPERFAIAAYHDLNDNGELDRGLFNAPTEPYGFSNNARSLTGPPTYEQAVIDRPDPRSVIEIRVY